MTRPSAWVLTFLRMWRCATADVHVKRAPPAATSQDTQAGRLVSSLCLELCIPLPLHSKSLGALSPGCTSQVPSSL